MRATDFLIRDKKLFTRMRNKSEAECVLKQRYESVTLVFIADFLLPLQSKQQGNDTGRI